MNFKPWKQPLLTGLALVAGTTAATAQTANVQAAQRSIELGRYSEARAALRPGNSPEAAYELGRLYVKRDLPDSAAFYFRKASSQTPVGMVAAGRALLAKGQVTDAETQFDAAVKASKGKDARILTMIAQAYADGTGPNIGKAQTYVEAAQKINKKDEPSLMIARGDIFLRTETGGGDAMSSYERAITANPSYAPAYYRKGRLEVRSRNFNDAQTDLAKATQLDQTYAPAYRELADMYYFAGKYDLALSTFQQYTGVAERSSSTDAQYASFLYLTKKYPEALTEVNKVLVAEPNNLTMNRLRPYLLYETGDYAQANTAMETYMRLAPAEKVIADDYAYQGRILTKAGQPAAAIEVLKKAMAADPSKADDLTNDLASAYISDQQFAKAAQLYKDKLTKGKGDLTDQFRLATVYGSAKMYPQADSVYNIILTAKPTYGPGYLARASNIYNLDMDSKKGLAKPYYEKYIELSKAEGADPAKFRAGLITANNYLGYYNLQQDKKTEALPYYEQVLVLDPTNQNAATAVGIIKAKPKTTTTTRKTTTTTIKK